MVFITGDCHGNFRRFGRRYFPEQEAMDRDDYIIVAGDFGGVWADTPEENYWLDWLEQRPFTTLFVDGNHENFRRLDTFPVRTWHGGSVPQIRPHVLHLMRGQLYEIMGKTFFTMGGAKTMWKTASWIRRIRTSMPNSEYCNAPADTDSGYWAAPGGRKSCPPMKNTTPPWGHWIRQTGE